MMYLDYRRYEEALARHFGDADARKARLVGRNRSHDSGYSDIVRFFDEGGPDPGAVKIDHLARPFRFSDERVAEYSREMETQLRDEGRLYDGPLATRLVKADFHSCRPTMTVQPCRYGDQAGSCFALDLPHRLFAGCGETLREYYLNTHFDRGLEGHPLAICLGVCGLLMIQHEERTKLFTVGRTGDLASLEDSIGPTVAGSVDYDADDRTLADMIDRSLRAEIDEELGLADGEYEIIPLAYGREILRGERPQLFCLIMSRLSQEEVEHHMTGRSSEFDRIYSHDVIAGAVSSEAAGTMNHECLMNYYLAEEYWSGPASRPGLPPDAPSAPRS